MLLLGRHILPGKKNYPFLQTAPCQGAQFGSSPTQCLRWEPLHRSQPAQPCTGALGSANTASSLPACHSSQLKGKLPLQTVRATLCLFPKSPSLFNWFDLMKKIIFCHVACADSGLFLVGHFQDDFALLVIVDSLVFYLNSPSLLGTYLRQYK